MKSKIFQSVRFASLAAVAALAVWYLIAFFPFSALRFVYQLY